MMDGIGAEVWQKIRSAITAKLIELGAPLCDEELPEYIMVMVGNKKSKSQMDEGLKLFLGSNTSHFTNWLHQVLQKLEEVTIPSLGVKNIGSSSSKKKSHNDALKKKKKLKSSSKEKKVAKKFKNIIEEKYIKKEKDVSDNEIIEGTVANNTNQHTVEIVQSFDRNDENTKEDELRESSGQIEAENSNSTTKEKFPNPIDGDEDEFLNIRADIEADDLMEGDMESSEANFDISKNELPSKVNTTKNDEHSENEKSNIKLRSVSPTNSDKESMNKLDARHLLNRRTDARELLNRKAAARLSINVKSSSTTSERKPLKRNYNDRSYDRHSSKRDLLSDDDRKKDRDNEKYRGVKRRSSEISDIQDKTHNRLNKILYSAREENSKKTKVSSSTSDLSKDEVKSRLRGCETEDKKRTGVLSRVVPLGRRGDDSSEVPIPSVIRVTPRPRRPLSEQANHKLIFKAMADANKSTASLQPRLDLQQSKKMERSLFSRSSTDTSKIPPDKISISITNDQSQSTGNNSGHKSKEILEVNKEGSLNSNLEILEDEFIFENSIEEEGLEENENDSEMFENWLKPGNESVQYINSVLSDVTNNAMPEENSFSDVKVNEPQFVVTMNNMNVSLIYNTSYEDEDLEDFEKPESEFMENNNILTIQSKGIKRKRPISPIIVRSTNNSNLVDVMEVTKSKPNERCKYWPNCRTGDQCIYHHPVLTCKLFPNCKFGDHCLFIHPQCKFNAACTRRDCPFSHTTSTLSVPALIKNVQACRFFPKCTNLNCPFYHPKICKFGSYCTKKDCLFVHKEIASVEKLKWSREGTS